MLYLAPTLRDLSDLGGPARNTSVNTALQSLGHTNSHVKVAIV